MPSPYTRRWLRIPLGVLLLLVAACGIFYLVSRPPADRRAFWAIHHEWNAADEELREALRPGASEQEKSEARTALDARRQPLAERCLRLADQYPDTTGEIAALLTAASRAPDTPAGKEALRRLGERASSASLDHFATPFDWQMGPRDRLKPLAPALLARARQDADHPKAARLLTAVCTITARRDEAERPAIFKEAADLIAARHADSPEIANFCECFNALHGDLPWAGG